MIRSDGEAKIEQFSNEPIPRQEAHAQYLVQLRLPERVGAIVRLPLFAVVVDPFGHEVNDKRTNCQRPVHLMFGCKTVWWRPPRTPGRRSRLRTLNCIRFIPLRIDLFEGHERRQVPRGGSLRPFGPLRLLVCNRHRFPRKDLLKSGKSLRLSPLAIFGLLAYI